MDNMFVAETPEEPKAITLLSDEDLATIHLFRGTKPLRPSSRYKGLNQSQVNALIEIQIPAKLNQIYVGGLVTLELNANQHINLKAFKQYIRERSLYFYLNNELNELTNSYKSIRTLIIKRIKNREIISNEVKKSQSILKKIGNSLLPNDFISLVRNPEGFSKVTLPRLGNYYLSIIKEFDAMSKINTLVDLVAELQQGIIDEPSSVPLIDCSPEHIAEVPEPSYKKIGKYNRRKALESKARLANSIYENLRPYLKHMDERKRKQEIAKIKGLRPSIKIIKAYYRAKGDTPAAVNMIVTPEKYPDLPVVWLTKRQQNALIDIINGHENKHSNFIANGFI